jgi:hypothetical protein
MNMLAPSSSVRFTHIACYRKSFLLHYTQVLCQSRLYTADHARTTKETQSVHCWEGLFTDSLPNNIRPIVACVGSRGNIFTESLPSNGSNCHNILILGTRGFEPHNSLFMFTTLAYVAYILKGFFFFNSGLCGYCHCGHSWPIVPASGDSEEDCGEADGM